MGVLSLPIHAFWSAICKFITSPHDTHSAKMSSFTAISSITVRCFKKSDCLEQISNARLKIEIRKFFKNVSRECRLITYTPIYANLESLLVLKHVRLKENIFLVTASQHKYVPPCSSKVDIVSGDYELPK